MNPAILGKLLTLVLGAIDAYRSARDRVKAAGEVIDPATGVMKTDAELIALFKLDAVAFRDHAREVRQKYEGGA